jgi:uncharacterized protein RhaS with RHS repeats
MRDYDPTTGRYLQADPLGLVDGASVYGYALQSPLVDTDATGLTVQVVIGGRVCNFSDKCIAYWSDIDLQVKILQPGQRTPYWSDIDFIYKDSDWYKCRAMGTCYAHNDRVTQLGLIKPKFHKQPWRIKEPSLWHPSDDGLTPIAEDLLDSSCCQ